ncbi:hypothetical protein LY78DRAFT_674890 [Colletotrichum sublineola]|nr:hypothetical protein LY78DRAFT_674890 [Colletotrichum sublineola]
MHANISALPRSWIPTRLYWTCRVPPFLAALIKSPYLSIDNTVRKRNTVLLKEKVKHSLRSVSSRFSLNDKFAATRQKNEFGGDDASIIDCMTLADNSTVAANPGAPDPNALDGAERGIKGVVVSKKKFLLVKTGDSEEDTDLQTPTM